MSTEHKVVECVSEIENVNEVTSVPSFIPHILFYICGEYNDFWTVQTGSTGTIVKVFQPATCWLVVKTSVWGSCTIVRKHDCQAHWMEEQVLRFDVTMHDATSMSCLDALAGPPEDVESRLFRKCTLSEHFK